MKFENPDPDPKTWKNRNPDPIRFVQNMLKPAGLESWNPDPVHLWPWGVVLIVYGRRTKVNSVWYGLIMHFCDSNHEITRMQHEQIQ